MFAVHSRVNQSKEKNVAEKVTSCLTGSVTLAFNLHRSAVLVRLAKETAAEYHPGSMMAEHLAEMVQTSMVIA